MARRRRGAGSQRPDERRTARRATRRLTSPATRNGAAGIGTMRLPRGLSCIVPAGLQAEPARHDEIEDVDRAGRESARHAARTEVDSRGRSFTFPRARGRPTDPACDTRRARAEPWSSAYQSSAKAGITKTESGTGAISTAGARRAARSRGMPRDNRSGAAASVSGPRAPAIGRAAEEVREAIRAA